MPEPKSAELQLKEACQLTGAAWAVLAERRNGQWIVHASHRLAKPKLSTLSGFVGQTAVDTWLCGAMSGGHSRSRSLAAVSKLAAARLFVFPLDGTSQVILVGAEEQNPSAQRIWRLAARLIQSITAAAASAEQFLPNLQTELPYDMPRALDRVLASFVQALACQGAWLAIRRGEALDILAQWNDPPGMGASLEIESNRLLRRVNRSLTAVSVARGQPEWGEIPHIRRKSNTRTWICQPLIIGQRLIGAVTLWRQSDFSAEEEQNLRDLAAQISPSVEVIVTFAELTGHLRRLAMLNDFALTVSSAQNLNQIARRVFGLLARAFTTELISIYLLSMDGRMLREFRDRDGKFAAQSVALDGHALASFLTEGRLLRLGDVRGSGFSAVHPEARSVLIVPLKYRRQAIGVISLESVRPQAFSQYDEHLMVVIASHLAGLVEYSRLREEAEARARNLGLIHEVVQQVVRLTDKREVAQITVDLLAQFFAYELAAVVLLDQQGKMAIRGFGGTQADVVRRALAGLEFVNEKGITAYVVSTGDSVLVNDTSQDQLYSPLPGWNAGSEMCVALKDGDRIMGIIDVESSQRNAFTQNDLLAIESLAGILANVVSGADHYQRLQETVHQLRTTQVELRTRMEAQQDAERRLVQAAKLAAVGEMSAGIAHELNNPLTTVTGFTELVLDETPQDAPHRADLELVLREAKRARDVVRHLLDFSRQGERTRARADMNEIVEDVIALTRHLIHTNGVRLNVDRGKDLPWVSVDRNQMKQVILNLIHNALQAMPSGGSLDIQTTVRAKNNRHWLTVSVKDSGVGIDIRHKDRIFEPFFTTKSDQGGTGLGLSVTYGIITDHGGTIEVESALDAGSCFTVWLPI